jgi:hypothetical protein
MLTGPKLAQKFEVLKQITVPYQMYKGQNKT